MTDQRLPISLWKYYRMNYLVHAIVLLVILVFAAAEQNFVIVGFCTLAIVTTIIGAWLKHTPDSDGSNKIFILATFCSDISHSRSGDISSLLYW
jgi:hypothetical protein